MSSLPTRDKANWLIHSHYVRGENETCLRLIEEQLRAFHALCEYPLYIKGLIRRQQGQIAESLQLFQAATALNPRNAANLKQVARSLFLLGRHKAAIDVYSEAEKFGLEAPSYVNGDEDWEIWHYKGVCYAHMKAYTEAEDCFLRANDIARHDSTYLALGKNYANQRQYRKALDVYLEALEYTPEHPELVTRTGLLYLRLGDSYKAFEYLGNALTHDPRDAKAILAAGSIIQDHGDADVALVKYRVAALQIPNSAQLWNNIGMAFFSKTKYVAAIACLKRALYLDPFEWIIAYNVGLVHLHTGQYASAYHHLTAAIQLKPSNANMASAYSLLGLALYRLDDIENASAAYEKAITVEKDHMTHLNYCVMLEALGKKDRAREQLKFFDTIVQSLPEATRSSIDPGTLETREALATSLL